MHRCFRKVVRCDIVDQDMKLLASKENECQSICPGECARDVYNAHEGDRMELCGPPVHAEAKAVDEIIRKYGDLHGAGATAYISGNDYVCRPCFQSLDSIGVKRIVMA
jgi:deoxycytidylate deaminase